MKIIALKGAQNTGKTTTLNELFDKLKNDEKHFKLVKNKYKIKIEEDEEIPKKDFLAVFYSLEINQKIGISSAGDTGNMLTKTLEKLKCDIAITACRTRGETCEAIEAFDSNPIYIRKTLNKYDFNYSACDKMDIESILYELNKINIKK